MDDFLRCKICKELYDSTTRRPMILPCGHTICEYCLKIIFKSSQIKCPFDKKLHSFKDRHEIGINYQLYELFSEKEQQISCSEHSNQILKFYCSLENIPICQLCLLKGHLSPNHQVVPLKETISMEELSKKTNFFLECSKNAQQASKEIKMDLEMELIKSTNHLTNIKEKLYYEINAQYKQALEEGLLENQQEIANFKKEMNVLEKIQEENSKNLMELSNYKENEQINSEKLQEILKNSQYITKTSIFTKKKSEKNGDYFSLLSKKKKELYLKAQVSNYDKKNLAMLKQLKTKGLLKKDEIFWALCQINQKNYVRPEDKTLVFVDIYKSLKFGYNYTIPSPIVISKILEELKPMEKKSCQVLEIGCGTGYITALLANLIGCKGNVISIEQNENLLAIAKRNIKEYNPEILERVDFQMKDYKNLTFPNRTFDVIFVSVVMQSFPVEFEEMLKLNGVLWASIGSTATKNVSNYVFEKDRKGEVRSRKVDIPEASFFLY